MSWESNIWCKKYFQTFHYFKSSLGAHDFYYPALANKNLSWQHQLKDQRFSNVCQIIFDSLHYLECSICYGHWTACKRILLDESVQCGVWFVWADGASIDRKYSLVLRRMKFYHTGYCEWKFSLQERFFILENWFFSFSILPKNHLSLINRAIVCCQPKIWSRWKFCVQGMSI